MADTQNFPYETRLNVYYQPLSRRESFTGQGRVSVQ
jgi:hypothetical protein